MDVHAPRLKVSPRLRELMAYPKFRNTPTRLLVLENEYWLDSACVGAAARLGWVVQGVPVRMQGTMSRGLIADFFGALTEFRPDFVLSINLGGMDTQGLFARLFADLAIPYATWFVDDPRTIVMGSRAYASDYAVAFSWEAAYLDYLRACGFAEAHLLPLAVDETIFNAPPVDTPPLPPSFVGNSMVEFSEREAVWINARPALVAAVQKAFEMGRVTRARFAEGIAAVLGAEASQFDADELRHAELYCFVEATRRLRQDLADAVGGLGVVMHGDVGWQGRATNAGGPIHYFDALPKHYQDTPINLNITSVQMAGAVNQRVFDCPAAGGFLLTDAQSSLNDLFDTDQELAVYRDLAECTALLEHYAAAPALRRAMVERTRQRVLAEHTYCHRLETMRAVLRARAWA